MGFPISMLSACMTDYFLEQEKGYDSQNQECHIFHVVGGKDPKKMTLACGVNDRNDEQRWTKKREKRHVQLFQLQKRLNRTYALIITLWEVLDNGNSKGSVFFYKRIEKNELWLYKYINTI